MQGRRNSSFNNQGFTVQTAVSGNTAGGAVASFIFCLVFVAIFLFTGHRFYLAVTSGSWPTIEGHISRSAVKELAGGPDVGSNSFQVDLAYNYTLKDKEYTGTQATFGIFDALPGFNRGANRASQIVSTYPIDKSVKVHYNPGDPSEAVLEPGPTFGLYYWLAFSIFILAGQVFYQIEKASGSFSQTSPNQFIRVIGMMAFVFGGISTFLFNINPPVSSHQESSPKAAATGDIRAADQLASDAYTAKYRIKDAAKVEAIYLQALDAIEKSYGKYSGKNYDKLVELGIYCAKIGEIDKGIAYEQKACDIWPKVCASVNWNDHVLIVSDLSELLLNEKHDKKNAEKVLIDMAQAEAKTLGPDHPLVQNTYTNLASFYEQTNQKAKAESLYRKMLEALARSVGKNSDEYARGQADLGALLVDEGKKAEGKPLLEAAYTSMKKSFGDSAPITQWAAVKLGEASR